MRERSDANVKVEQGLTFTLTRGFLPIVSLPPALLALTLLAAGEREDLWHPG